MTVPKNIKEKVYCSKCAKKTNHKIITTHGERPTDITDLYWETDYHIVQCLGCDEIAFVKRYFDEDSYSYEGEEKIYEDTYTVYPEEPIKTGNRLYERYVIEPRDYAYAPVEIVNFYYQIIESYNMNHMILCTSGLRTLIEVLCSEKAIKKGYLYEDDGTKKLDEDGVPRKKDSLGGKIFGLYENGLILFPQALLLQKIKDIGNGAIHEIKVPGVSTLKGAIHVIEDIIYNIYEIKNHRLLR